MRIYRIAQEQDADLFMEAFKDFQEEERMREWKKYRYVWCVGGDMFRWMGMACQAYEGAGVECQLAPKARLYRIPVGRYNSLPSDGNGPFLPLTPDNSGKMVRFWDPDDVEDLEQYVRKDMPWVKAAGTE